MSYRFDKVCELKVGDILWEGSQYGSIKFEVLTAPVVTELARDEDADSTGIFPVKTESKVEFTAKSLNEKSERVINYMLNSKYMHYGPQLYSENRTCLVKKWMHGVLKPRLRTLPWMLKKPH